MPVRQFPGPDEGLVFDPPPAGSDPRRVPGSRPEQEPDSGHQHDRPHGHDIKRAARNFGSVSFGAVNPSRTRLLPASVVPEAIVTRP
jgi:hypothetical protein